MNLTQRPVYICHFRDGTKRTGTYAETLELFNAALGTDNPCTITPHDFAPYKAP